jgi:hypothetical protein
LDPFVVGRHQYIRNGATGGRLFIDMLNHRLPAEHGQRFPGKT